MKRAHTPGPWDGDERGLVTKGEYRLHIATVGQTGMGYAAEANTKLIAAAPDLLAVVQEFLSVWDAGSQAFPISMARAAVRKATA